MKGKLSDREREMLTDLIERHHLRLRAYLCRRLPDRETREDLLQEVFLSAVPNLRRLEEMGPEEAGRFLVGVGRNKVRRHWERAARRRSVPMGDFLEKFFGVDEEPTDREEVMVESERRLRILRNCVDKLGKASRKLVEKRFFERCSSAGLARELGESEGGMRVRLFRIRRKLRHCMEQGFLKG